MMAMLKKIGRKLSSRIKKNKPQTLSVEHKGKWLKIVNTKVEKLNGWAEYILPKYVFCTNFRAYSNYAYLYFIGEILGKTSEQATYVPHNFKVVVVDKKKVPKDIIKVTAMEMLKTKLAHTSLDMHVGCDPEIFCVDNNGVVVPAFEFLPSKNKAERLGFEGERAYWDGFQAEFETSPKTCLSYHVDSVQQGLNLVKKALLKHNGEATLSLKTVVDIPQEMRDSAKPEHVEFGCMPSFNVYNMKGLGTDGRATPFRPAGGHIHFGVNVLSTAYGKKKIPNIVKALDAILGVACVSMFEGVDDERRRSLYGLAGEYRTPKHGLEYRTLSNAWLSHPMIMNLVFDLSRKAFMVGYNNILDDVWQHKEKHTIEVINTNKVEEARKILDENEKTMKALLYACYGEYGADAVKEAYNVFRKGLKTVIANPEDVSGNWELGKTVFHHNNELTKKWSTCFKLVSTGNKIA